MLNVAVAAALGLVLSAPPTPASAQPRDLLQFATTVQEHGSVHKVPRDRAVSRRSGLSMEVDTRWANRYGYRPILVTVSAPQPTTVDRSITIRIYGGWWSRNQGAMIVEQDFDLPTGSTSGGATISFPRFQQGSQYLWWDVWVDGVRDRDLSIDMQTAWSTTGAMGAGVSASPSLLVPGQAGTRRQLHTPGAMEFEALSLPIGEFPVRWTDYTSFDVVALSFAELQSLMQGNPEAAVALRRWVQAGGQVWISDAGEAWERLAEVGAAFHLKGLLPGEERPDGKDATVVAGGLPADEAQDDPNEPFAPRFGWLPVEFSFGGRRGRAMRFTDLATGELQVVRNPAEIARLLQDPNYAVAAQEFGDTYGMQGEYGIDDESDEARPFGRRRRDRPSDSSQWFVEHEAGLGSVRAFRGPWFEAVQPRRMPRGPGLGNAPVDEGMGGGFAGSSPVMATETRLALASVDGWTSRHGLAPDQGNREFANWLVPGVGLAPVMEFRVLITLFVVLIGPVNYWLLKRTRRLHLLVLTVPLAAAAMTVALFAYAMVSDGFGTKVRVRSVTTLDQRTGEAACWARISYYSGLAPAHGLTFPSDVAIYPILAEWNETGGGGEGARRELLWEPERGRYTRGWLQSRTPTQYLAIRSRRSPSRIEFAAGEAMLRATNELGTLVRYVVVADVAGELFSGEAIATGETVALRPAARNVAIRRLRELIIENTPVAPAALSDEEAAFVLMERRSRRRFGLQSSTERLSDSLLEGVIADLGGMGGVAALSLPPRSYVAVTERGPEVDTGFAKAREEAGFHVVVGQW